MSTETQVVAATEVGSAIDVFNLAELGVEGFVFRPAKFQINHNSAKFDSPLGESLAQLQSVILTTATWRLYFVDGTGIICSSKNGVKGVDMNGKERSCALCPKNRYTKGKDGTRVPCKESRRITFLPNGYKMPVYMFVPPKSLKNTDGFFSALTSQGKPLYTAEALMTLSGEMNDKKQKYAMLHLNLNKWLTADEVKLYQQYAEYLNRVNVVYDEEPTEDDFDIGAMVKAKAEQDAAMTSALDENVF